MIPVIWADSAKADLQAIEAYYDDLRPGLGRLIIERILSAFRILSSHPRIGAPMRSKRFRRWRARKTPYLLMYRVAGDQVTIVHVRHDRTNWRGE